MTKPALYKRGAIFTFPETRFGHSAIEQIAMSAIGAPPLTLLYPVKEGEQFPPLDGGEATMYAVIGHTLAAFGTKKTAGHFLGEEFVSLSIVRQGDEHKVRMVCRSLAAKGDE